LAEVTDEVVVPEPRAVPWFRPYLSGRTAGGLPTWPADPAPHVAFTSNTELPLRRPGEQLVPSPTPAPARAVTVDPEVVRARLSAFAEGVSAALRRSNPALVSSAQKDR
jgi:hypothetical protein